MFDFDLSFGEFGLRFTTIITALQIVLLVLALAIVPRNRRPSSAMAWILAIIAVPIAGIVLFALIGSPKLPAARREKQNSIDDRIEEVARELEPVALSHSAPRWLPRVAQLNQNVGAMPLLEGNDAELIPHFPEQLTALIEAIDAADRYVHVEFYILIRDHTTAPFFAAMERAVARGVDVKLLVDHIGSFRYPGWKATLRELTRIKVDWRLMLPVQPLKGRYQRPDLRNHRKLLVVDGEIAFVGSLNLIDPSYDKPGNKRRGLKWHDLLARVEGPVVHEVDALFVTDWFSETDELLDTSREQADLSARQGSLLAQIAPSGPGFTDENNLLLFNSLMYYADRRISITSPYFVPDESLSAAILTAARRGVEIELFVGEIGDQFFVFHAQHSYYEQLLDAGVKIWLYPKPAILHAKHVSIDDDVAVVGSSNMDIRSFNLDLEVSLMVCGRSFVDQMRAVEDEYRSVSRQLTAKEWAQRGRLHRFADNVTRLTSAVQ